MNNPAPPALKTDKPVDLGLGGDAGFPAPPGFNPTPHPTNTTKPPTLPPTAHPITPQKPSRRKIVIGLFYLSLLGVGLILGLETAKQRQEIRKFAQTSQTSPFPGPTNYQPPRPDAPLGVLETFVLWVRLGFTSLTTPR